MDDIINIAKQIFSQPPKDPNSIQLDFSDSDVDLNNEDIFKILLTMFQQGMVVHFGDENERVDLSNIAHQDFSKINQYFNSFNFNVSYSIKPLNYTVPNYEKKNLGDYYLRLKCNNMLYFISFDHFIADTDCKNI